jgi:Flp pilus assembly pilin Flp
MRFMRDNKGIESTEVALIIAVVVLVSYGAYRLLGNNIAATVQDIAGRI